MILQYELIAVAVLIFVAVLSSGFLTFEVFSLRLALHKLYGSDCRPLVHSIFVSSDSSRRRLSSLIVSNAFASRMQLYAFLCGSPRWRLGSSQNYQSFRFNFQRIDVTVVLLAVMSSLAFVVKDLRIIFAFACAS